MKTQEILVVYWEWAEGKHKGARFWGCHTRDGNSVEADGRLRDWPSWGLRAIGAATVTVTEGEGLELLPATAIGDGAVNIMPSPPGPPLLSD